MNNATKIAQLEKRVAELEENLAELRRELLIPNRVADRPAPMDGPRPGWPTPPPFGQFPNKPTLIGDATTTHPTPLHT